MKIVKHTNVKARNVCLPMDDWIFVASDEATAGSVIAKQDLKEDVNTLNFLDSLVRELKNLFICK